MLALAQGDRARAERIARTPPPGVDPTELAYYFARFEELGWLLDDAQQRRLLELDVAFYEGDRGNWGLVNAQLYTMRGQPALARAYRRHGPARLRSSHPGRHRMTRSSMPY